MRVGLPRNRVGVVERWCTIASKPRQREIERVPEEVDGAGLAAVPAGELLEDPLRPLECAPEFAHHFGVVARVRTVGWEGRRDGDAVRDVENRDVNAQLPQDRMNAAVELRDRKSVVERQLLDRTFVLSDAEVVVEKVEVDGEPEAVLRLQQPRCQTASVHVERDVPPVVPRR